MAEEPHKHKAFAQRLRELLSEFDQQPRDRDLQELSAEELIEELRVYQAELEAQNDELRRSQFELGEARDRYALLFDSAPVGYLLLDKDFGIIDANRRAQRMLSKQLSLLQRRNFMGFLSQQTLRKFLGWTLDNRYSSRRSLEAELLSAAGEEMRVRLDIAPVPAADARQYRFLVSVIDIEDAQRARRELEQAEERYHQLSLYNRRILDAQPQIVVVNDGEKLVDANWAFYEFFGYESLDAFRAEHDCICDFFEEVPDKDHYIWDGKDDRSWVDILCEQPRSWYQAQMTRDGRRYCFLLNYAAFRPDSDDTRHIVSLQDISELEAYREMLEEQVQKEIERRQEQEKSLQQRARLALIGETISSIAHHWRQPLNQIALTLEIMREDVEQHCAPDHREHLVNDMEDLQRTVQELSSIITEFRTFFEPQDRPAMFGLQDELVRVTVLMSPQMREDGIRFDVPDPGGDIRLHGYAREFSQSLLHLLNNARDAILERRRRHSDDERQDFVRLDVQVQSDRINIDIEDSGGGIPAEIADRVFLPYFSTKSVASGSGMGLHMARLVIEDKMLGKLGYENREQGACFRICLPRNLTGELLD